MVVRDNRQRPERRRKFSLSTSHLHTPPSYVQRIWSPHHHHLSLPGELHCIKNALPASHHSSWQLRACPCRAFAHRRNTAIYDEKTDNERQHVFHIKNIQLDNLWIFLMHYLFKIIKFRRDFIRGVCIICL